MALLRALLWDAAQSPFVFGWLAAVPALRIGETCFDPGFGQGGIDGAALALAAALLPAVAPRARRRAAVAELLASRLRERTGFAPIPGPPGGTGVYPRLALRAPDARARDAALVALRAIGSGASVLYPCALDELPALRPCLAGGGDQPGARDLAARLLTLPTHRLPGARRLEALLAALERVR
jgi:dTDP-4-amino-4,6-dideoxygalactose transaminase